MARKTVKIPGSYALKKSENKYGRKAAALAPDDIAKWNNIHMQENVWQAITGKILSEQSLRDTLEFICNQLVQTFGYRRACIGIKEQAGTVIVYAIVGAVDKLKDEQYVRWDDTPEGQNPIGRAIQSGQPQVYTLDESCEGRVFNQLWAKLKPSTLVVFPLQGKTETLGVLSVCLNESQQLNSRVMSQLEYFAMQAALAVISAQDHRIRTHSKLIYERSSDIFILLNLKGNIIEANKAALQAYGYTREELLGLSFSELFARGGNGDNPNKIGKVGTDIQFESVHLSKGGRAFPVEIIAQSDIVGDFPVFLTIIRDISQRKQAEEALWYEKELAQVTLNSIGDGVITTAKDGKIEALNLVAEQLTGWPSAEAKEMPLLEVFNIVDEISGEQLEDPVLKCLQMKSVLKLDYRTRLIHRQGYSYALAVSVAPIRDRLGAIIGAVLVFRNVSDKRKLVQQLFDQSRHDTLTKLPNRLLFNEYLNQVLLKAAVKQSLVGLLFLDIDRFKLVNDTMGHAWGDILLQAIGERLSGCIRAEDMVARQGGDEFLILLPELGTSQTAVDIADRVIEVLAAPFVLDQQEVHVSASVGIAIYPRDGDNSEELVKHADAAMYYAKAQGRNNYQFYTAKANVAVGEKLSLENKLRKALLSEELVVYYQPQVDLSSGKISGLEALVRWQTPDRGIMVPAQFIPIAEETGLISLIDRLVLQMASKQMRSWQKAGYNFNRITVNLSARQFRYPNLVDSIMHILEHAELEPSYLEIEITESVAIDDVEFTIETLRELKKQGIRISIDDFGMGFSSLGHLRQFPLDTLKIDQSFTKDIGRNRSGTEIAGAIISLAQILNLRVVAEGVETNEQLEFLKTRQCDEIQGYLFSKPVTAVEIERMFLENKCLAV